MASVIYIPRRHLMLPPQRKLRAWNINYKASLVGGGGGGGGLMGLPLIYSDGWESFSNAQTISGTNINWFQNNPNSIKASNTFARTGSKSVFFPFGPSASGFVTLELDGSFGNWVTGSLDGGFHEVEFEYYLRIPSGYVHPDSPYSDNNKFFRIWGWKVGDFNPTDYNTITKLGCSTELGTGGTSYSDMAPEWDDNGGAGFTARGTSAQNIFGPADAGVWTRINWYVKAATSKGGAGRAYLKMWKNGTLVIDERPDNYLAGDPTSYYWFYLFGARNTDDEPTEPEIDIYMDDLSIFAQ